MAGIFGLALEDIRLAGSPEWPRHFEKTSIHGRCCGQDTASSRTLHSTELSSEQIKFWQNWSDHLSLRLSKLCYIRATSLLRHVTRYAPKLLSCMPCGIRQLQVGHVSGSCCLQRRRARPTNGQSTDVRKAATNRNYWLTFQLA